MIKLTVLEFERFCKENKYNQFIFNLCDQVEKFTGVGNCSASMRFANVAAFPCPDTIYFTSKYKETYISFTNVIRIEFEEGEGGITNSAMIICRDESTKNGENRFYLIVDKK